MEKIETLVIGAGAIGLAISRELAAAGQEVLLLDECQSFGQGISSRSSEVIHAGIYYPETSLKTILCVKGKTLLYHYCQENEISHQKIGKLIIANNEADIPRLKQLQKQAYNNQVTDLEWLDRSELIRLEPKLNAVAALHSPSTGIIDSHQLMMQLLADLESFGGCFVGNSQVTGIEISNNQFVANVQINQQEFYKIAANRVINAAGLMAVDVANSILPAFPPTLIPTLYYSRGHYFSLRGKAPFKQLVYPLPEARQQGLGIHYTLDLAGQARFGPDTQYINHIDYSIPEERKEKFIQAIRRYYPSIQKDDIQPDYAGIRPKLQGPGRPFSDFIIQGPSVHKIKNLINLFGIESPGITASLAIAQYVKQKLSE